MNGFFSGTLFMVFILIKQVVLFFIDTVLGYFYGDL
jgi:hypothetical protein